MPSLPFLRLPGLLSLVSLFFAVSVHGQGTTEGVVEVTSAKNFPGYVVDDVVVPVPSEIFSVLDKLGEPNWRQELRGVDTADTTDRTRLSLIFGSVVAEGFVAVPAQDKKPVEEHRARRSSTCPRAWAFTSPCCPTRRAFWTPPTAATGRPFARNLT